MNAEEVLKKLEQMLESSQDFKITLKNLNQEFQFLDNQIESLDLNWSTKNLENEKSEQDKIEEFEEIMFLQKLVDPEPQIDYFELKFIGFSGNLEQ